MVMMTSFLPCRQPARRPSAVPSAHRQQFAKDAACGGVYDGGVLQVRVLGGVAGEREGEQLSLPPPTGRLLALLALRPGAQDRETVAAALWPSAAGPAARANLRTAVWALRKA